MSFNTEKLYRLLPEIYQIRDAGQGQPLRELLAVVAEQLAVLEEDLAQLYDDQFIETCAPWAVPYIGDLIGYRSLHHVSPRLDSPRAEVANTIGYRRRKGTAAMLEQLARDVTGWNARVVEFFQLLATAQFMNHIRPANHYSPDLRQWEPLERLNTAFETTAHLVNVRHVTNGEGKYNIPNIGVFFWRLDAFRLRSSPPVELDPQRFFFSPLGANMPLFSRVETEDSVTHLAEPINVPERLSRRYLDANLAGYYGTGLSFFIEGFGLAQVMICNLEDTGSGAWAHTPPAGRVAVDPVLGRIAFGAIQTPAPRVTFHYGFSAEMGGGEYERADSFDAGLALVQTVTAPAAIQPALDATVAGGVVEITDSGRYAETPSISMNAAARLELRAANEHRPSIVLGGNFDVRGGEDSSVTLNGLLISGGPLRLPGGAGQRLRRLRLVHCTLVPGLTLNIDGTAGTPGAPSLLIEQTDGPIQIEIDRCIIGAIRTTDNATVRITDSIVDAHEATNVAFANLDGAAPGGALRIENSTVIGRINTMALELASNSIVLARSSGGAAPARSERRQTGCVRFSWLPLDSRVPRRYRCQPDLEISVRIEEAIRRSSTGSISNAERAAIRSAVLARLAPAFTSLRYGDPGYCQLHASCPVQIRAGADDESEMGAFHDLFQPQRESNVRTRLREYLRFGLEAGIFYES